MSGSALPVRSPAGVWSDERGDSGWGTATAGGAGGTIAPAVPEATVDGSVDGDAGVSRARRPAVPCASGAADRGEGSAAWRPPVVGVGNGVLCSVTAASSGLTACAGCSAAGGDGTAIVGVPVTERFQDVSAPLKYVPVAAATNAAAATTAPARLRHHADPLRPRTAGGVAVPRGLVLASESTGGIAERASAASSIRQRAMSTRRSSRLS